MADESSKLTLDLTDVYSKLDGYDRRLAQIEQGYVDIGKAAKTASKSFVPEGDGAVKQLDDINKLKSEYVKLKTASDTLKTALKTAYDPRAIATYTKELKNAEVGLKKLEDTGKAVGVNLKKVGEEGSLAAQVVSEAFGAITKATLILAIIDQVVKLTKEAVSLSNSFDKAQKSFNAFTGDADKAAKLVNALTSVANKNILNPEDVFQAGQSLLAFGENADRLPDVLNRVAIIARATGKDFNELATIYGKARTAGTLYAEDINQLVEAGIPIIGQFAKQLGVSEGAIKKLASEGKISFEELQLAFFNLSKEGSQFSKLAAEQATTLPNLYNGLVNKLAPILKSVGDFITNFLKGAAIQIGIFIDNMTGAANERLTQKLADKAAEVTFNAGSFESNILFIKKKSEEELRLEKEAADKRKELTKKNAKELEAEQKEIQQLRIDAMADGEAKEIAQETARFAALSKELKKYHISSIDAEKQYQDNVIKIKVKYALDRTKEDADAFREQLLQGEKIRKQGLKATEEIKKFASDQRKKESEARADEIALNQALFKESELQQRRAFFSKKRTADEIKEFEKRIAKEREIFQLKMQSEELKRTLEFGTNLSETEKSSLKKRIENIQTEIGQIQAGLGEDSKVSKPKSIIELLGFKSGGEEDQALKQAVSAVKDAIDQITQARIEAAAEARRVADENVTKAEDALNAELDLQKQGFANNVAARRADLEDSKKAQADAIEQQKKAARQRALIDAATQASSIATAAAEFFASSAPVPFVGVALAIAAIATMLSTISRVRASFAAAAKFREGGEGFIQDNGMVTGRSHSDGGNLMEIEKGELFQVGQDGSKKRFSVVRRERVAEYFDLLDAANRGDRRALARHAFELSGGQTPDMDHAAITKRLTESSDSATKAGESRENNRSITLMEKMLELMVKHSKKEEWTPDGRAKRKGNTTTHYSNGGNKG
jgi:tape measure domain-containing protein